MNGLIEAIRTNSNDPDPDLLLVRFHLASGAVTVTDLHEPFRAALAAHLPNATAVADAFHVVAVGTRVVDRTRRRVRQETLGHRGHKDEPLYRSRKLLTMAAERLDEGLDSLIKKLKRVATAFRSFANYRLRILLAVGGCNWDLLGTQPH